MLKTHELARRVPTNLIVTHTNVLNTSYKTNEIFIFLQYYGFNNFCGFEFSWIEETLSFRGYLISWLY